MIDELVLWWEALLSLLPCSIMGNYCRRRYWARKLRVPKGDLSIFPGVHLSCLEALEIGQGVCINYNVIIDPCEGFISIGDNVLIGPNCVLRAADHIFGDPEQPIRNQGHAAGRIIIEDDCWLGANVVVLRNVRIGRGSIVGAGAIVTKDIPPFSIAAGVPARVLGRRGK